MAEITQTVTRREFIARFVRDIGVSYAQATRMYDCMCNVFEDGIVRGSKIRVGQVGSLTPVWRPPREIKMHFKVGKGKKVIRAQRTYVMDGRYVYKFNLYQHFINTHALRWFADMDAGNAV